MSTPIAPTLLATSVTPLTLTTGFPTLTTSVNAVAYDKTTSFTWKDGAKFMGATVWRAELTVKVRFFAGIVGPAYAITMKPSMSYEDSAVTTSYSYTYCQTTNGVKTCGLTTNVDPAGGPGVTDVVEKVTKRLPRLVKVDIIGEQQVYGGFCMGTWLYVRVESRGNIVGKKWDFTGECQINLLNLLLQLALLASFYRNAYKESKDQVAKAQEEAKSLGEKAKKAFVDQGTYATQSAAASALTGDLTSFYASAKSGLTTSAGAKITPTLALNLNLIDFLPYVATFAAIASTIGLKSFLGPYINVGFPVTTKITQLSVDGVSSNVKTYAPITADFVSTTSESGEPGGPNPPDPVPTTPAKVGVTLSAVPGIDLSLGLEVSLSFGKYFKKKWKLDVTQDYTSALNKAFGSIPSKVVNTLANDVGSTSAATVTRT
jgi:hypothetical protein